MGMKHKPEVQLLPDGSRTWAAQFESFSAQAYVPEEDPRANMINYGFKAPYLLVFEEEETGLGEKIEFAERSGLARMAASFSGSVVFIRPLNEGGWETATEELFTELIAASAIRQDYEDGLVRERKRFTGEMGDWQIRGAIFRTFLFGFGASADYIARCCMKTLQGQYLWGPGEITPTAVILENLSTVPTPERRDIPVVSVNNSPEINRALEASCDHFRMCEHADYPEMFTSFLGRYKRWCGVLEQEEDLAALGMAEDDLVMTVRTSEDNRGDFTGTKEHQTGVVVWYRHELRDQGPMPLVLAFHGGGDSAFHIGWVSGWWRVAMRNDFLLAAVDNHLNCSATEIQDIIRQLREQYPIDETRIYATGFSMGGCKTWDLYQEYPATFAALAPMDATFEVGKNQWGEYTDKLINRMVPVPVFYAAGEKTPLPELPCQAEKCLDRIAYVFGVNQVKKPFTAVFAEKDQWEDPLWGMAADRVKEIQDPSRGSVLRLHEYDSTDGRCKTVLADISGQGHECREHTCEHAWQFMSQFHR